MDRKNILLRFNRSILLIFVLLLFIDATTLYSQTTIGIAPGESCQFVREPIISILPVTDVTIKILGEDSLYVAGTVDSFRIIEGSLRIKTYYTLSVLLTAPTRNLSIKVLLSYTAENILIQNILEIFLIDAGVPPSIIPNFSAEPIEGSAPLKVSFSNESTGYIIGYYWDFGDETTSLEENPQHTYLTAGTYSVSLTVFNFNVQNQITKQDYINVRDITSLENDKPIKPNEIYLNQNYPNPFNASTTINYTLRNTNNVGLTVFDINGKVVKTLVNQIQSPGEYSVPFDATNLASGIYIYNFKSGSIEQSRRMILLR